MLIATIKTHDQNDWREGEIISLHLSTSAEMLRGCKAQGRHHQYVRWQDDAIEAELQAMRSRKDPHPQVIYPYATYLEYVDGTSVTKRAMTRRSRVRANFSSLSPEKRASVRSDSEYVDVLEANEVSKEVEAFASKEVGR